MTESDTAACGHCEGLGYTIKIVLGHPGVRVECPECDGAGKDTGR